MGFSGYVPGISTLHHSKSLLFISQLAPSLLLLKMSTFHQHTSLVVYAMHNVMVHFSWGGIFNHHVIANFPEHAPVDFFLKIRPHLVKLWHFFWPTREQLGHKNGLTISEQSNVLQALHKCLARQLLLRSFHPQLTGFSMLWSERVTQQSHSR